MALFSRSKKQVAEPARAPSTVVSSADLSHVLVNPRITEKATMGTASGIYVFDVSRVASKQDIKKAVERYYKVRPRLVRVVTIPVKTTRNARTNHRGMKGGGRKAYVYLNKGETITIA